MELIYNGGLAIHESQRKLSAQIIMIDKYGKGYNIFVSNIHSSKKVRKETEIMMIM